MFALSSRQECTSVESPLRLLNAGKQLTKLGWNIAFYILKQQEIPQITFEAFKAFISKPTI